MDLNLPLLGGVDSFTALYYLLLAFVHVAFAAGVARDAGLLVQHRGGTLLVGPYVWTFATLLGGVFVALAYWTLHHVLAAYQRHQP